jgi:hypothetical protein
VYSAGGEVCRVHMGGKGDGVHTPLLEG